MPRIGEHLQTNQEKKKQRIGISLPTLQKFKNIRKYYEQLYANTLHSISERHK